MKKAIGFISLILFLGACGSTQQPDFPPANRVPVVALAASSTSGTAPLVVTFTAQATDPDGDSLTYAWSFGDGSIAPSSSTQTHTYTVPGEYVAAVTVSDGRGGAATAAVGISVFPASVTTGSLSVYVAGVDRATVRITSSATGFDQTGEAPITFTSFPPGGYTITPQPIEGYTAAPVSAVVRANEHTNVTITYTRDISSPTDPD